MSVARGRPRAEAGGRSGSIANHSASVVSLSYRRPLRLYCRRVISVQTIVLSLESSQIRRNHNRLKSLSFFFSPALREAAALAVPQSTPPLRGSLNAAEVARMSEALYGKLLADDEAFRFGGRARVAETVGWIRRNEN